MDCFVCKKKGVTKIGIEDQSEEIALCESCLDAFENGELEGAITLLLGNDD